MEDEDIMPMDEDLVALLLIAGTSMGICETPGIIASWVVWHEHCVSVTVTTRTSAEASGAKARLRLTGSMGLLAWRAPVSMLLLLHRDPERSSKAYFVSMYFLDCVHAARDRAY
jgi:hypothetical protein